MAAIKTTTVAYNPPGATVATPNTTTQEFHRVAAALGVPATMHTDTIPRNVTVDANDRWLLLGPGTTPAGVTVVVKPNGVVMIL